MTEVTNPTQDKQQQIAKYCDLIAQLNELPIVNEIDNGFANLVMEVAQDLTTESGRDVFADALRFNKARIVERLSKEPEAASEKNAQDEEAYSLLCWLLGYLLPEELKGGLKRQWKAVFKAYNDGTPYEFSYLLFRLRDLKEAMGNFAPLAGERTKTASKAAQPAAAHVQPDPDDREAFEAYHEDLNNRPAIAIMDVVPGDEFKFLDKAGNPIAHLESVEDSGILSLKLSVWSVESGNRLAFTSIDYDTAPSSAEPTAHDAYKPKDEIEAAMAALYDFNLPGIVAEKLDAAILAYTDIRDSKPVSGDEPTPMIDEKSVTEAVAHLMSLPMPQLLNDALSQALCGLTSSTVGDATRDPDLIRVWLPGLILE